MSKHANELIEIGTSLEMGARLLDVFRLKPIPQVVRSHLDMTASSLHLAQRQLDMAREALPPEPPKHD